MTARQRAYRVVRTAIKQGRLIVPDICAVCDTHPRRGKDGRRLIQAHHHNGYDSPLDVQWLCVDCHRAETPCNPLRGSAAKNAKLSEDRVAHILRREMSAREYAAHYGVTKGLINQVYRGVAWRHVSALIGADNAR